jgi:hypothetical protein
MIPKTIHYCWFGGPETEMVRDCVESWRRSMPDYEIKRWSQDNFDVSRNAHARGWYRNRLYSFVADYARTKVLYEHGGIYLDSDTYVFSGQTFDHLLDLNAFIGFQYPWPKIQGPDSLENNRIGTGIIGCHPRDPFIKDLLNLFNDESKSTVFDVTHPDFVLPVDHAKALLMSYGLTEYGRTTINGVTVMPKEYFLQGLISPSRTPKEATAESICVHLGALAWKPLLDEYRQPPLRRLGKRVLRSLRLLEFAKAVRSRVLPTPPPRRRPSE